MTQKKTHIDITLYGLSRALSGPAPVGSVYRAARRNRRLCERHGHDWKSVRTACVERLRKVSGARGNSSA